MPCSGATTLNKVVWWHPNYQTQIPNFPLFTEEYQPWEMSLRRDPLLSFTALIRWVNIYQMIANTTNTVKQEKSVHLQAYILMENDKPSQVPTYKIL